MGQKGVGSHLAKRGFFISAGLLEDDVSTVGVSLTKDRGPCGLCGIDSIIWRITGWLMDISGSTWGLPGQDVRRISKH